MPTSPGWLSGGEGSDVVRVLVTGADGFVGRHLVARLVETGHEVLAGCRPGGEPLERWLGARWRGAVRMVPIELTDTDSVQAALSSSCDAVAHLAALASSSEARQDPAKAWVVNAAGTARVVEAAAALRTSGTADPRVLVISSAEVYGEGRGAPRTEEDPVAPQSAYAASKAGSEIAALEVWRRAGLRVVIARPFPHTGAGQPANYVVPAFAQRLRAAKASGATEVATGNLDPIRDLLDVRDVVEAYLALLAHGAVGETYNIARGDGVTLRDLFQRLAGLIGVPAQPVPDPTLVRPGDIVHLVGDSTKLRNATGWAPTVTLDQTLREVVDAQAR
ncbi:MAG: NAD-dependent epimerase/dehydratase family protein [Gemmatimonadales bacterium]